MLVFVGTYTDPILFGTGKILQGKGEGIYVYRLDPASGALAFVSQTIGISNPSYLAFDATQKFLYAVNELKMFEGKPTGTVSAFAVDAQTGKLKFLNRQLTHGTDPCHVLVGGQRTHVFVANFMSGACAYCRCSTTAAWEKPRTSFNIRARVSIRSGNGALMPTRSRLMRRSASPSFPISGSTN